MRVSFCAWDPIPVPERVSRCDAAVSPYPFGLFGSTAQYRAASVQSTGTLSSWAQSVLHFENSGYGHNTNLNPRYQSARHHDVGRFQSSAEAFDTRRASYLFLFSDQERDQSPQ